MSEHRTPEEEAIVDAEAQQYPGHENPDAQRELAGLDPESGEKPEGAPLKRDGQATENDE